MKESTRLGTSGQITSLERLCWSIEKPTRLRNSIPVEKDYHRHKVGWDPADNAMFRAARNRTSVPLRSVTAIHIQSNSRSHMLKLVQPSRHMIDVIESGDIEPANNAWLIRLARCERELNGCVLRDDASAGSAGEIGAAHQIPLQTHPGTSRFPQTRTGELLEGAQVW